jgi:hypothetical protein
MRTLRSAAAKLLLLSFCSCGHADWFDSCTRLREFKEFNYPSRAYFALPKVPRAALPPHVYQSLAAACKNDDRRCLIDEVRVKGEYLLITTHGGSTDHGWLVYSTRRSCMVGLFVLAPQE